MADTKVCRGCGRPLPLSSYTVDRSAADGLKKICRDCSAIRFARYYSQNRSKLIERATESTRRRRERPDVVKKERIASREAKRRQLADPAAYAEHLARGRQWTRNNPGRAKKFKHAAKEFRAARAAARVARIKHAMPAWADIKEIAKIYAEAARKTEETGVLHNVDHMAPLAGRLTSGLHVHWNLRVIVASENQSKGARFIEDLAVAAFVAPGMEIRPILEA